MFNQHSIKGSVLASKKRTRSYSLKAMPQVSIGDGYTFVAVKEFREHTDFVTKVKLFRDSTSVSFNQFQFPSFECNCIHDDHKTTNTNTYLGSFRIFQIALSAGNDGLLVHYDLNTGAVHKRRAHRKGITDFDMCVMVHLGLGFKFLLVFPIFCVPHV
jgi:hypothetical protein